KRLPTIRAEGSLQYWDKALGFAVAPGAPEFVIRDRLTMSGSITAAQPISGLFVLSTLVGLEEHALSAARAELEQSRLDVAYRAAEAYLRALQARAAADVAGALVTQVEAQLERAEALRDGGALGQVDVLRIKAAADEARAGALRAEADATTAGRAVALAIGLDPRQTFGLTDDLPATPPEVRWGEDQAVRMALDARPELVAAREREAQAHTAESAAKAAYLPTVSGVATYQRNEGLGTLQPKDAWFIGAIASWELWNWNQTGAAVDAAEFAARRAELARGAVVDQVLFEVRQRWLDARTAHATLAVAASGLAAAEEAHRIQSIRFGEGAATTTDVLEAETGVARARTGAAVARYGYYIALVGLARAIGEPPAKLSEH